MDCNSLKRLFLTATAAVDPILMLRNSVKITNSHLVIEKQRFEIKKPCFVVGFGKAVLGMAVELERILDSKLQSGIVNVPFGIFETFRDRPDLLPKRNSRLQFIEGAKDNLPDENAMKGALAIKKLAQQLNGDDLLIVLISGGGSALLPLPKQPVKLQEKLELIENLTRRGADIIELNCVRKKLSTIKGGGLARIAYPAKVVSLILSDIVGDSVDSIASGPTTPNWISSKHPWQIIEKYSLSDKIPESVKNILHSANDDDVFETDEEKLVKLYDENGKFVHVDHFVLGHNRKATERVSEEAQSLGYQSIVITTKIQSSVDRIALIYSTLCKLIVHLLDTDDDGDQKNLTKNKNKLNDFLKLIQSEIGIENLTIDNMLGLNYKCPNGICVIGAGEPTVVVKSQEGKGGRNQELTLRVSLEINKLNLKSAEISFLSCGTDGIDGPTDAAGAIGGSNLVPEAIRQNLNPDSFLSKSDSYTFFSNFQNGRNLVKIGHTGTNVMDIHIMIIKTKKKSENTR